MQPGAFALATVANNGLYRVLQVDHVGDTRGQEWYSNIIGLSLDPTTTATQNAIGEAQAAQDEEE